MVTTFCSCFNQTMEISFRWPYFLNKQSQRGNFSTKMNITWAHLYPSITSWWALAINLRLFVWLNCSDISWNKAWVQNEHWEVNNHSKCFKKCHKYRESTVKYIVTWPKVYPAPRGETPQPHLSSGSDHNRSHIGPSWGTSWKRSKFLILSRVSIVGESPPCKQNISDSTC